MNESRPTSTEADLEALKALQADASELEHLESLLDQFNVFEAIGFVNQEVMHSLFLAFLLDSNQNHGIGDHFLERFLQEYSDSAKRLSLPLTFESIEEWNLDQTMVNTEVYTDDGRIDILLLNEFGKWAMIIENKIWSTERSDQLNRYYKYVEDNYPGWQVLGIYLTPHGTLASLKEKYSPLSYGTVCEIVEDILESKASRLSPDVKMSMQHYVQMVRRHIVGDSEIVRLSRDIYQKHKRAFDFIYEHRPDVQAQIRPIVEDLIRSEHPRLKPDASRKDNIKFVVGEWDNKPALLTAEGYTQSGHILIFEVWNSRSSLDLHLYIGPGPEAIRRGLLEMVRANPNVFKMPSSVKGDWLRIFSRPLLKQEAYESLEQEEREEDIRREWERFVERDLPRIEAALKKEAWIWESSKPEASA